jgi:hypothetical protein
MTSLKHSKISNRRSEMKMLCLILATASLASACTPRGFKPPPSDEEAMTSKSRPTVNHVRQTLHECGDLQPKHEGESQTNANARVIECMFQKGFYFKSGWGGHCAVPDYREKLPACQNAPVRPRNTYYGQ